MQAWTMRWRMGVSVSSKSAGECGIYRVFATGAFSCCYVLCTSNPVVCMHASPAQFDIPWNACTQWVTDLGRWHRIEKLMILLLVDHILDALMAASELSIPRQEAGRRYASACRYRMMHESTYLRKRGFSVHLSADLATDAPSVRDGCRSYHSCVRPLSKRAANNDQRSLSLWWTTQTSQFKFSSNETIPRPTDFLIGPECAG